MQTYLVPLSTVKGTYASLSESWQSRSQSQQNFIQAYFKTHQSINLNGLQRPEPFWNNCNTVYTYEACKTLIGHIKPTNPSVWMTYKGQRSFRKSEKLFK